MNKEDVNNSKKKYYIIIIVLLFILLILLGLLSFNNKKKDNNVGGTRTLMIYISGTNLERDAKSVTLDLNTIYPKEVNLDDVTVLLYTGGTSKWHNFIRNDENAIYKLTEDGFTKLESYKITSMGDGNTLSSFMNYSYDYSKTDKYDLIIYDHGGALQGAVTDDYFKNDIVTLEEFQTAFNSSPFNGDNKLELLMFTACLMQTAEVALTFSPYADYLVASEEIIYGGLYGYYDFINGINRNQSALDLGKSFIKSYIDYVEKLDPYGQWVTTYSIIDLGKIDNVFNEISKYVKKLNIKDNYGTISKVRQSIYQFGEDAPEYDTVDAYNFFEKLGNESKVKSDDVLKALNEAILYSYSIDDNLKGLSLYFPFNGVDKAQLYTMDIYKLFSEGKDYLSFINAFYNYKSGNSSKALTAESMASSNPKINNNEFSLQLTQDEAREYANSSYMIFKKMNDEYYNFVYSSDDSELTDDLVLKTNITNKIIKIKEVSDNDGNKIDNAYLQVVNTKKDGYRAIGTISNFNKETLKDNNIWDIKTVYYYFKDLNGVPSITNVVTRGREDLNELPNKSVLNISDYTHFEFLTYWYKIFDENGNFTKDWKSYKTIYGYEFETSKKDNFEFVSLDKSDDYICIFKIDDIYGKTTYSKPVSLK